MLYLLVIYIVFIAGFVAFSAAGFFHLRRFGYLGDLTRPVMCIYTILSLAIIITSIILIIVRILSPEASL